MFKEQQKNGAFFMFCSRQRGRRFHYIEWLRLLTFYFHFLHHHSLIRPRYPGINNRKINGPEVVGGEEEENKKKKRRQNC